MAKSRQKKILTFSGNVGILFRNFFFTFYGNLLKVADAEKTNKFAALKMFIKRVGSLTE
jgi:hypothetical protein